jgi:hypothetical protein
MVLLQLEAELAALKRAIARLLGISPAQVSVDYLNALPQVDPLTGSPTKTTEPLSERQRKLMARLQGQGETPPTAARLGRPGHWGSGEGPATGSRPNSASGSQVRLCHVQCVDDLGVFGCFWACAQLHLLGT